MGLYNFKARFAPFIKNGTKTHTIRAIRKNPDKPGNTIHCYTGLRQKGAKLLGRFKCVEVEPIEIDSDHFVYVDGVELDIGEREALARRDGFKDFADMMAFWNGRLPFQGHIIHWKKA